MPKTAEQIARKYSERVAQSGPAYEDGIRNPSKSWSEGYTRNIPKMVANLQRAIAENRPQRAVAAMGDSGWQQRTLQKSGNYAAAAPIAGQRYAEIAQRVLDAGNAGRNAARQIEGTTWPQRLQKVKANAEAIAAHWGKPLT